MKRFCLILLFAALCACGAKAQGVNDDVFIPIVKYLSTGDIDRLSVWFAPYLDVNLLVSRPPVSREHGARLLKYFFGDRIPTSLSITNTASNGKFKYAVGDLVFDDDHYFISLTISLNNEGTSYQIQQIKITR